MPLVDVTYDASVTDADLRLLAERLPDLVAEAVECPEEPWTGPPAPGDIEIRFRARNAHDVGDLRVVVEVRTKVFPSRLLDSNRRAEVIRDRLAELGLGPLGVWLILHEGSWSQTP